LGLLLGVAAWWATPRLARRAIRRSRRQRTRTARRDWRSGRALALFDVAVAVGFVVADYFEIVPFSSTPFFLALGWISLRLRGRRYRDVGLARPKSWPRALAIGAVAGILLELVSTFVTVPLLSRLAGQPPDLSDFQPLVGNLSLVLIFLAPLWLGSCAEEVAYRGYLVNRFADLAGRPSWAWVPAVILVGALFGWSHGGQGITGMVQEGFAGLVLGLLYLASGRNLIVPSVAHAAANTLAFVLIYLDRYPGI
jgi:membrane protease YdiL (CAAX protease family)